MEAIVDCHILVDLWARDIVKLQAKKRQDTENVRAIKAKQCNLHGDIEAIADLEALHDEVMKYWSDINLHCNIGHVQYAAAISVDVEGGTLYTSDWAVFLADEAKVRDEFKGNVVDLGTFRLTIFTSSNENNLIQDPSTVLKNLHICSIPLVVVRPHSSFLMRGSFRLRAAPRRKTSPTLQRLMVKASTASWSANTATLLTSLSDAMPA